MGGLATLRRRASLIESVHRGTITVTGTLTATATIPAVDLTRASVAILGLSTTDTTGDLNRHFTRIELTNATTVTITRADATTTDVISYEVRQYAMGVFRSIQRGTISLGGTSVTATITAVDPNKSEVDCLGQTTTETADWSTAVARVALTNGTTVTGTRQTNTGTTVIGFEVREFY